MSPTLRAFSQPGWPPARVFADWLASWRAQGLEFQLIEHAIDETLLIPHELWITVPGVGGTVFPRVVVFHRPACGCDLLPDHVLLEG